MPLVINASGYIEVWRDGALVSRHNVESNAIEAIVAHAEANGDGDYELRYPNKVVMSRLRKQVVPFTWNPITLAFVNGTASGVNLAGFLANPENRAVSYSVTGTLPAGVTLTGSTVAYNGTGAVASASVRFNAAWNGLTATSNPSTVSVNAAAPANRAPVFTVAPTTATIPYTGGTVQFTATDPDADTLTYTLPTTRTGITINSGTGLVTVASSAAGTTGSITVRATDPSGAYAQASCAVTVQSAPTGDVPYSPTTWGGVILTQAQHEAAIPGTNNPHFERTWFNSGGWNGEGFMRWRVAYTQAEDADGYNLLHPGTTTRSIFLSFVGRIGSTWWQHHTSADRFKFVMFYPAAQTNPRPTIFNMPIFAGDGGAYSYRTWGPATEAGGGDIDEFGTGAFDWNDNYPNHQYKENSTASGWYFYVMALEGNRTRVYLWSRAGQIIGAEAASLGQTFYAQSREVSGALLTSWNAQTWTNPRLLAYIEATTAGDANAYMDIGRIRITQTLPTPPAGFVTG